LFEIDEACACVAIDTMDRLRLDPPQVNVNGGSIALGHPAAMTGARLALTLALELRRRGGGNGLATLTGRGGQGDAMLIRVPGEH
jgi:acetyl-CoA C-acetyltransferase